MSRNSRLKNKIQGSFKALIQGAWVATFDERKKFYFFIGLFTLSNLLNLLVPWTIGYTLNIFAKYGYSDEAIKKMFLGILAYAALRLICALLHHYAIYIENIVAYSAKMQTLTKIFYNLLRFPLRWHVGHHSGENLSKLLRSAGAIEGMIGNYIRQIIEGTVMVIFAGLALFTLDFWVAAYVLLMSAFTIGIMIFFNAKLTARFRKNNIFYNKLNRICVDYLSNIVTVKTLGVEKSANRILSSQKQEGLAISRSISALMELKWGSTTIGNILVISISLLIYFFSHKHKNLPIEIGQVYVLLDYLNRIFTAIGSFTGYYSAMIEAATAYEDATEIFEEVAKIPEKSSTTDYNPSWNSIKLEKLNFSYISGDKVGLNNVSLEFKRGEKIALVGHSGSGKTTLLKVFGGIISPDNYSLSSDLQSSIAMEDLVNDCLLIPQEPEIFSDSAIYNLTMGDEFDPKEISFFISLCKADQIISALPHGLESNLAQRGSNLSVGEKQRLAIARGLLRAKQKEILLLDEPTSSLDPKTEKEIFLGLLYHFSSRTIISSCHRLNLIPLFDRIVLMSNSAVLENGTFAELIEARGHLYRIWEDYERNIKSNSSNQSQVENKEV